MNEVKLKRRTDFLLPVNSFLVGIGSVLNISGSYFSYSTSESEAEADSKALVSDWSAIGDDIRLVISKHIG